MKKWQRRFFALKEGRLSVFKDEESYRRGQATCFLQLDKFTQLKREALQGRPHCISVRTSLRAYVLACESDSEADAWMRCLLR